MTDKDSNSNIFNIYTFLLYLYENLTVNIVLCS